MSVDMDVKLDEAKLQAFMNRFVTDLGATLHAGLVVIGAKLGLYKAMADAGRPLTAADLASRTSTHERYVQEWLSAQAASGYVDYDAQSGRFTLPPEQAFALTNPAGPAYLPGAFQLAASALRAVPRLIESFKTGAGLGWHEHDTGLFEGTELFFRPNYVSNLLSSWIPALEGVQDKLQRGARVADVGCGHGASTILMAQAFPRSTFIGYDYHEPSIEAARAAARRASVAGRVTFEAAAAQGYPGKDLDLVAFFDCLHDMGDPAGAAAHVRASLAPEGTWMIVEPFAHDTLEANLNPVGRVYYSASTLICTPASRAQEGKAGLGAQAGEARLREVVEKGGLHRFRRVAETPFNLVFEARP